GDRRARAPRLRDEGRNEASRRARARADADRDYARRGARARTRRNLLAASGDEPVGLRLLARGRVSVQGPARSGPVDPADEVLVLLGDLRRVAVVDGRPQPPRERLHRRAIAKVLEPLASRDPDA